VLGYASGVDRRPAQAALDCALDVPSRAPLTAFHRGSPR
jgi:hypothetical protein